MDEREEIFLTHIAAGVDPLTAYAATPREEKPSEEKPAGKKCSCKALTILILFAVLWIVLSILW